MFDEDKIKSLASKIIWGLTKYKPQKESESKALIDAIEWFSSVAVDDWPNGDAKDFPSEIENLIVFPFVHNAFKRCMIEFLSETKGDSSKIEAIHEKKLIDLKPESKEEYMDRGLALGYLRHARGKLDRLFSGSVFLTK